MLEFDSKEPTSLMLIYMKLSEFTEEDLKELAKQLSRPYGDIGIQVANTMNETNITMTLNAIRHLSL